MKKFIYMITIALTMLTGVDIVMAENKVIEVEDKKINVCTYNIGNVQFVVTQNGDNDIKYVVSGEDSENVFENTKFTGQKKNLINSSDFYTEGQFGCANVKACKSVDPITGENYWFLDTSKNSNCAITKEYTGKLTQENILNTDTVCEYSMTVGDNKNIWLKATYDAKKNSVKLTQDTLDVSKAKIKVDKKIFLKNGKFECVPKSEIAIEQCLNKKSEIGMMYWKSSSDNKLYCSGLSTKYINEIKYDDNTDNYVPKTYTQGQTLALVQSLYNIIKILVPVIIISLSIIDFLKVILISDDKNYKSAWDKFIKRLIIGVIFFLVPLLVEFILKYSGIGIEQSYTEIFK